MRLTPFFILLAILPSCEKEMTWINASLVNERGPANGSVRFDGFQFYLRDSEVSQQDALLKSEYPMIGPAWGADQTPEEQFFLISPFNESGTSEVSITASTSPPASKNFSFLGCLPFLVSSGKICVDGYAENEIITMELPTGHYSCYVAFYLPNKIAIHFSTQKAIKFGDITDQPKS